MKILWLAWKDIRHPGAGGAEVVLWELSKRLVANGHEVSVLTCGYPGAGANDTIDGVRVIRIGSNRCLHPFQALWYYGCYLRNNFDIVIETVNTAVYFAVLLGGTARRYVLYHQLAREIWFCETKPPLSWLGYYVLEPLAAHLLAWSHTPAITVSDSTRRDLWRFGFRRSQVSIISEGIRLSVLADLKSAKKYTKPTLLSLGAMRAMKRTADQIAAFEAAKAAIPELQLKISGSAKDAYGQEVLRRIAASPYAKDIEYLGRVSDADKLLLMRRAHLIMVTSLKEGWGLIVTEANSQGTPAVVYDVDGLCDSVRHGETGLVTPANPAALAQGVVELITNHKLYDQYRQAAWEWSKSISFERCYDDFKKAISLGEELAMVSTEQPQPTVSVIVTTKDSQDTLAACLQSIKDQSYPNIELVVVDNYSTDDTVNIARRFTSQVYSKGPERCAQRNYAVSKSTGEYVVIIDSDMELTKDVIADCVAIAGPVPELTGVIIPEESFGEGFWAQCKRLERSFYVGIDWIEAARFFRRQAFLEVGGYNEALVSGEDWDLSQRIAQAGKLDRIHSFIRHNEGRINLFKTLKKKSYYAQKFTSYTNRVHADGQESTTQPVAKNSTRNPYIIVLRRFGLFLAHPVKLFRNPALGVGVLYMKVCEFGFGAIGYLSQPKPQPESEAVNE